MALCTNAAMVLFYDIAGDNADHDDWHTYEHMHERLSIPGFVRGTRWVATNGKPKYMAIYEVAALDVASSPAYLERLNNPTPWTSSMMTRFRGMVRGFCSVAASSGVGLGNAARAVRFTPKTAAPDFRDRLAREVLPAVAARRGMASTHLFEPAPPPPMTKEQSIRGADTPMPWLLLATAYDAEVLTHLEPAILERYGAAQMETGSYALHYTLTAQEATRTAPNPPRVRAAR